MQYVLNLSPSGRVISAAEKSDHDNHRESPELIQWDVKSVYAGDSDEVRSVYAFEVVEHVSEMGKAFAKRNNADRSEDDFDNKNSGDVRSTNPEAERKSNWHGFEWDMEVKKAQELRVNCGMEPFVLPQLTGDEVEEFLNKNASDMNIRKNPVEQKSAVESETVADEKRSVYAFDMNAEDDAHSEVDDDEESYYSDSDSSDGEEDDGVKSEYAFDFYGSDGVESEYAFDYYNGKDSDAKKVTTPTNVNAERANNAPSCCFASCFLDNATWPDLKKIGGCVREKFAEYPIRRMITSIFIMHLVHFFLHLPYYVSGKKTL